MLGGSDGKRILDSWHKMMCPRLSLKLSPICSKRHECNERFCPITIPDSRTFRKFTPAPYASKKYMKTTAACLSVVVKARAENVPF